MPAIRQKRRQELNTQSSTKRTECAICDWLSRLAQRCWACRPWGHFSRAAAGWHWPAKSASAGRRRMTNQPWDVGRHVIWASKSTRTPALADCACQCHTGEYHRAMSTNTPNFAGLRVAGFESRRAEEMAAMVARFGGLPSISPSMRRSGRGQESRGGRFRRAFDDRADRRGRVHDGRRHSAADDATRSASRSQAVSGIAVRCHHDHSRAEADRGACANSA